MKKSVLVIGLGTFGYQAARALYDGGATVLAMDNDERAVGQINGLVTRAICVDVNDEDALRAAGAFEMDVVIIAIRQDFAATILATHLFKNEGVREILVNVETDRQAQAVRTVGATSAILPERDTAERLAQHILIPDLADKIPIGEDVGIAEFECPASFVGKSLQELDIKNIYDVTIIAIKTPPEKGAGTPDVKVAPSPRAKLKANDILVVISEADKLEKFKATLDAARQEQATSQG